MKTVISNTIAQQSEQAAQDLAAFIRSHPGALLCLAAGDTPLPVYRRLVELARAGEVDLNSVFYVGLVELARAGEVDLNSVFYVGLDEWVGLGYETRGSCKQVMWDTFYGPAGIEPDRVADWNGLNADTAAEQERVMAFVRAHGGVDYTLLGIGMNGHVGFNEPGTGLAMGSLLVELDETTVSVSVKYFDRDTPVRQGLTLGAGELKAAKVLCLIANGSRKASIVRRVLCEPGTEAVPASLLMDHPNGFFYLDNEAAALL